MSSFVRFFREARSCDYSASNERASTRLLDDTSAPRTSLILSTTTTRSFYFRIFFIHNLLRFDGHVNYVWRYAIGEARVFNYVSEDHN